MHAWVQFANWSYKSTGYDLMAVYTAGSHTHEVVKVEHSSASSLHTFNAATPDICVETLTSDRKSKDFLGFRITENNKELDRFCADDIVTMRRFMASLGCDADGLFTRTTGGVFFVEAAHGLWDVAHPSEDELDLCQKMLDEKQLSHEKVDHFADTHPVYDIAGKHLPIGFYFHKNGILNSPDVGTRAAQAGGAMCNPGAPMPKAYRRQWHDTFLPPWGPPVFVPVSIGCGAEVGLQPELQELWDPNKKAYYFVDNINKVTFFEDPRPLPEQRPVVEKSTLVYGASKHEPITPPGVFSYQAIIEATSKRALSRPHGFVLTACGVDGEKGEDGVAGEKGATGEDGYKGRPAGARGGFGSQGGTGGPGTRGTRGGDGIEASDVILSIEGSSEELHVSGTCEAVARLW